MISMQWSSRISAVSFPETEDQLTAAKQEMHINTSACQPFWNEHQFYTQYEAVNIVRMASKDSESYYSAATSPIQISLSLQDDSWTAILYTNFAFTFILDLSVNGQDYLLLTTFVAGFSCHRLSWHLGYLSITFFIRGTPAISSGLKVVCGHW